MRYRVDVSAHVMAKVADRYGSERTARGAPDRYDFVGGPLAAALDRFRRFDELVAVVGPSVRLATIVDPFFGVVTFTGVLVATDRVEIADFEDDPDFWAKLDDEPDA
jgi:hypothetical protein